MDLNSLPTRSASPLPGRPGNDANLADILERVLDKGIVIAGDIQINLLDIELLTIKLRLLVASVDRAKEMGINWWESDPTLSRGAEELEEENRQLRERLERLEQAMGLPSGDSGDSGGQAELPAGDRERQAGSSAPATAASGGERRNVPAAERPEEPAGGR